MRQINLLQPENPQTCQQFYELDMKFHPTTQEEWDKSKEILQPSAFYDDDGYIYCENSKNILICRTRKFGRVGIKVGFCDVSRRLVEKAAGSEKLYPFLLSPIRFWYHYNWLGDFIITATRNDYLYGWKDDSPKVVVYTRDSVLREFKSSNEWDYKEWHTEEEKRKAMGAF